MLEILIGVLALMLSIFSFGLFLLLGLFPKLGVSWLQYSTQKRIGLHILALGMIGIAYYFSPNLFLIIVFILVCILLLMSLVSQPHNIFHALLKVNHILDAKEEDDCEILGVELNEASIAYPIWQLLAPHHIINDSLGDESFVVSYCPACRSGMVYNAKIDDRKFTFKVAGLYRKNMTFIDQETKSIWQQASGEAIYGKLKGKQLPFMFYTQTSWKDWKKDHPNTFLADELPGTKKSIVPKKVFDNMFMGGLITKLTLPGLNPKDTRLNQHEEVIGIKLDNIKKAYPIQILESKQKITDKINNQEIELIYSPDSKKVTAVNKAAGLALLVERHWWLSWSELYPETLIYENHPNKLG